MSDEVKLNFYKSVLQSTLMITKTCTWVEKADAQNIAFFLEKTHRNWRKFWELRISHLKMLGIMFYRC